MNNLSKISKLFLFIAVLSFFLWLGGYISRQIVIYQLFDPENLDLRTLYNNSNLYAVLNTVYPVITYNLITYPLFLITFIAFLIISRTSLKKEGWLFIIVASVAITAPFEIYLLTIDLTILKRMMHADVNNVSGIVDLLRDRITSLSSFSLIEIFVFMGAVFLFLFKPLRKTKYED